MTAVAPVKWASIVNAIRTTHHKNKGSVCFLRPLQSGDAPEVVVDLSRNGMATVKGREVGKKTLGRLLFGFRNTRFLRRRRAVVWTAYNPDTDESIVGFGAWTSREAANRLKRIVSDLSVEDVSQ